MPIGRSDGHAVTLFADGHTDSRLPSTLVDMRLWIDAADRKDFKFK